MLVNGDDHGLHRKGMEQQQQISHMPHKEKEGSNSQGSILVQSRGGDWKGVHNLAGQQAQGTQALRENTTGNAKITDTVQLMMVDGDELDLNQLGGETLVNIPIELPATGGILQEVLNNNMGTGFRIRG